MRRSAAPSQIQRKEVRSTLFSPPYKVPVRNAVNPTSKDHGNFTKSECYTSEKDVSSRNPNILDIENEKIINNVENILPESTENSSDKILRDTNPNVLHTSNVQNNVRYFSVVWCKLSKKKHKKWEGDAILIVKGRSVKLKDMEGKEIGSCSGYKIKDLELLSDGNTLPVGSKEVEIQNEISSESYVSGKCFQSSSATEDSEECVPKRPKLRPFRLPLRECSNNQTSERNSKPLYSATDVDALVLPKPPAQHRWSLNSDLSTVVDVVVDPRLAGHLRPHQRDGVVFLYECVMGFRRREFQGAILADEMGLGKTFQCITLIWTLLKQSPYNGVPTVKKVLIVVPSSLVANWKKEFDKWLGQEKIKPFVIDQNSKVVDFGLQTISPVMILSYEMLVRSADHVRSLGFDLMVCDEGHRLKNCQIKTTSVLNSLDINRRIIITGTPVQNDLQELYSLVEFVNPGLLGSSAMFRKVYEEPILSSQQPQATEEEKELGSSRAAELNRISSQFILRRTQEIINKYLPPKTEFVIFCQPSESQCDIYEAAVASSGLQSCLTKGEIGDHLSAICTLRKLSNHPGLLLKKDEDESSEARSDVAGLLPSDISRDVFLEEDSGKLAVVSCLLWSLAEFKREKIVIVSNFTSTLDMLEQLCVRYQYSFLRFDGSTPTGRRQGLVDRFNNQNGPEFVFLLSAKAGGVGLNLIGASRILLYDIDWNPATDLQAMARVWRDGQRKHVYIYRLLLAGSIEEKMYQRQVCKQGISSRVVDAQSNSKSHFSREELKDLFSFSPGVACLTHDLLNCPCDQMGGEGQASQTTPFKHRDCQLGNAEAKKSKGATTMDQLFHWQHLALPQATQMINDCHIESGADFISFVFKCETSYAAQL